MVAWLANYTNVICVFIYPWRIWTNSKPTCCNKFNSNSTQGGTSTKISSPNQNINIRNKNDININIRNNDWQSDSRFTLAFHIPFFAWIANYFLHDVVWTVVSKIVSNPNFRLIVNGKYIVWMGDTLIPLCKGSKMSPENTWKIHVLRVKLHLRIF